VISKWGEKEGVRGGSEGCFHFSIPQRSSPPPTPPIYLSLVVEGFVCINKWGEVGGGFGGAGIEAGNIL